MDKKKWQIGAAASLVVPITALLLWREAGWSLILFVVWTIAAAAAAVALERRHGREQTIRMREHSNRTLIRTLSHHRHDWLNELQLVYGYLRMSKSDKAVGVVERIRERMNHDSKVTHLGSPELIAYFLTFRTLCNTMRLDVEVEEGIYLDRLFPNSDKLPDVIIGLVNAFRRRAASAEVSANVLKVSFSKLEKERRLVIALGYEGELASIDSLESELNGLLDGWGTIASEEAGAEEHTKAHRMAAHIPLPA
ncbi:Spo0B domain-containing protein [Cohnella faecalis]|nr:Spo0B domain-containing protein [Cohnella faecalis]